MAHAKHQDLAARFLAALDAGQVPPGLRDELAAVGAALGGRLVRLAQEVREGGPHAWRRAIDLAELLYGFPGRDVAVGDATAERDQ